MHKRRLCCSAQLVAGRLVLVGALLGVSACGTVELFGQYDLPESPGVEEAPWPRLVDVPAAPPVGTYTADVPNPEQGAVAQRDLAAASVVAEIRRQELSQPVISDAERARMQQAARRRR